MSNVLLSSLFVLSLPKHQLPEHLQYVSTNMCTKPVLHRKWKHHLLKANQLSGAVHPGRGFIRQSSQMCKTEGQKDGGSQNHKERRTLLRSRKEGSMC